MKHQYEKEGHYFGDVFYLPDFYLPASQQFVEVKAIWSPDDCRKIQALLLHAPKRRLTGEDCPDVPIVACMPDGEFFGWPRSAARDRDFPDFPLRPAIPVELYRCEKCRQWWFGDPSMSWKCQCCGFYDGDQTFCYNLTAPLP